MLLVKMIIKHQVCRFIKFNGRKARSIESIYYYTSSDIEIKMNNQDIKENYRNRIISKQNYRLYF